MTDRGPDLARVVAPNPSPLTADGTNTWLLGRGALCVIDPGPEDASHLHTLMEEIAGREVAAILVTHAHRDHSGLAPRLSEATGAAVLAFGDWRAGITEASEEVGPGVDQAFRPDRTLADGEVLEGDGWRLRALHTPGHMGNHLCFDDGERLWTGDHAMGFATSIVSPPEGDMEAYIDSLERLIALGPRSLWPGHGEPVVDGLGRLRALLAHRRERESQVMGVLEAGPATAAAIAERVYSPAPPSLLRAATRNVLAHLLHLSRQGLVVAEGPEGDGATFRRV